MLYVRGVYECLLRTLNQGKPIALLNGRNDFRETHYKNIYLQLVISHALQIQICYGNYHSSAYITAHKALVIFSVPILCLPSPLSLPFLPNDPLELFAADSFVPFPESELLVILVPSESFEENRRGFTPADVEVDDPGAGATDREGRIIREFRALRMSWVVFRIISSTETLSAPNSADFLARSNCVSKCFVLCCRRLFSFSEASNYNKSITTNRKKIA